MLLDLTVSNFRSFADATTINLIPGREQKGSARLPLLESRYNKKVNPVAAIFGPNGSGKSNLVGALAALQRLLLEPLRDRQPIPLQPYKLKPELRNAPTRIEVLFEFRGFIYEYLVAYNSESIVDEQLTVFFSKNEQTILDRSAGTIATFSSQDHSQLLGGVLAMTPPNAPVISRFANSNFEPFEGLAKQRDKDIISHLLAPYLWIRNVMIVGAGMIDHLDLYLLDAKPGNWRETITAIDAGVTRVVEKPVEFSNLKFSPEEHKQIADALKISGTVELELNNRRYVFTGLDPDISAAEIQLAHRGPAGTDATLDWSEESDGTRNATRLLSLFDRIARPESRQILVIDELDRSFHTELSRALIDGFMETVEPSSRSQLIFTTHDLLLMDPDRFRKDQMWIVEKTRSGASQITSISEFAGLRSDKDIRKSYLEGRFGGVPAIAPLEFRRG